MGGQVSEVSDDDHARADGGRHLGGPNILQTSKALGLRTEASTRFEKQLHPEHAMAAQRLAARLMVELCGARMVPGTIDAYPEPAEPRGRACAWSGWSGCWARRSRGRGGRAILESLGFAVEARRRRST